MRKCWIFGLLLFMGCASTQIPTYLKKEKPYTKRFYAEHGNAVALTTQALESLGWVIEKKMDPLVYEQEQAHKFDIREILLVTEVRQTPLFLGTRYAKMNVFIRSKEDVSEIEIRYLTVTSVGFKTMSSYQNDKAVERILGRIEEELTK